MSQKANKPRLRDMIAADKARMLPIMFGMSYIVTPIYVTVTFILLMAFGSLIDQGKVAAGLTCLGIAAALSAAVLIAVPIVRRKAIRTELERYDLDGMLRERDALDPQEIWDFSTEEISLTFDRYGMKLGGERFYYNHLTKLLLTDNPGSRVVIYLYFAILDREEGGVAIPLTAGALRMLDDFDVKLDNQPMLDALLAHPEEAFTQIFKKGHINTELVGQAGS